MSALFERNRFARTLSAWDEISLSVWDVEIIEGIEPMANGAGKLVTEERCRAVLQILQRRLDMVKPDDSQWRQRASYVWVEPDYPGARVRLFFEGEVIGLSLRVSLVTLNEHEVASLALLVALGLPHASVPVDRAIGAGLPPKKAERSRGRSSVQPLPSHPGHRPASCPASCPQGRRAHRVPFLSFTRSSYPRWLVG